MAELWELICHHTYGGIPGVVVDLITASGASHGQVFGLDDGDFLADGVAPGSGSVRFYKQDGRIRVPTEAIPWQSIVGIKGEVTLRRQPSIGFIIDSDAFQLHVRGNTLDMPVAWFSSYPNQYSEISTVFDPIGPQPYRIPAGPWITLGFMHDGFGTMELYADGQVVARRDGVYGAGESARRRRPKHRQRAAQRGLVVQRRNRRSEDLAPQPAPGRGRVLRPADGPRDGGMLAALPAPDRRGVPAPSGLRQADRQVGSGGSRQFHSPGQRSRTGNAEQAAARRRRIQSPVARWARSTAPKWWTCLST